METIQSTGYPVHFQESAYKKLNEYLATQQHSNLFILVDENTHRDCLQKLMEELSTNLHIEIIEIESGEINKNLNTCIHLWHVLTELGADRKSLLINLGGGVITDMGGFVASAYKRGISFINIPTTLLSMVDASVGGKTGVDLGVLKNQIGVFSDPEMVLIDKDYLKTLSPKEITSGTAEIIKYGLTYDVKLWDEIKTSNLLNINYLVHRSVEIKNEIVIKDRLETELRKVLNFGHTIGHAVESYFLASDNKETLTHGEAIALGMIAESYLSHKHYNFPAENLKEIKNTLIDIFGKVPIEPSDYKAITDLLKHDKKNSGGQVNFVLLENFEKFKIDCKVNPTLIIESLDYYIE